MTTTKAIIHRQQLAADHAKLARLYMEHGMPRQAKLEQDTAARHYARARMGLGLLLLPKRMGTHETASRVEWLILCGATGDLGTVRRGGNWYVCKLPDGREFWLLYTEVVPGHWRYRAQYEMYPEGRATYGRTIENAVFALLTEYPPT